MKRSRGVAKLRIVSADGHLSRIGRVRMVLSKRPGERWKTTVAIVTNETGLRDPMRSGASDEDLEDLIRMAVRGKELRHRINEIGFEQPQRTMSSIGG